MPEPGNLLRAPEKKSARHEHMGRLRVVATATRQVAEQGGAAWSEVNRFRLPGVAVLLCAGLSGLVARFVSRGRSVAQANGEGVSEPGVDLLAADADGMASVVVGEGAPTVETLCDGSRGDAAAIARHPVHDGINGRRVAR